MFDSRNRTLLFPPTARRFVDLLRLSDVRLNVATYLLDLRHVDLVVCRRPNRLFRVRNAWRSSSLEERQFFGRQLASQARSNRRLIVPLDAACLCPGLHACR